MTALGSRRGFLASSAGAIAALGALAGPAGAATTAGDIEILNYALLLEELQAAFYSEAEQRKALDRCAAAGRAGDRRRRARAREGAA